MVIKKREKTQCYCDMHVQEWNSLLGTSPKVIIYRLFKVEHIYEPYLNILSLKKIELYILDLNYVIIDYQLKREDG